MSSVADANRFMFEYPESVPLGDAFGRVVTTLNSLMPLGALTGSPSALFAQPHGRLSSSREAEERRDASTIESATVLQTAVTDDAANREAVLERAADGPAVERHLPAHLPYSGNESSLEALLFRAVAEPVPEGVSIPWGVFASARNLVRALPSVVPAPEVSVERDGEVAFDWNEHPRRTLSVNVGDGQLGFAALIGQEAIYGRVPFGSALPDTLALILRKLFERVSDAHL